MDIITTDERLLEHLKNLPFISDNIAIECFDCAKQAIDAWNIDHDPFKIIQLPKQVKVFEKKEYTIDEPVIQYSFVPAESLISFLRLDDFCSSEFDSLIIERAKRGDFNIK